MDRRGTSVLLVPLIAALAFLYPSGNRLATRESTGQLAYRSSKTAKPSPPTSEQWHGGRLAVQKFFGFSEESQDFSGLGTPDPRLHSEVEFVIATVPDPIDSGLSYSYDRILASIEAAAQRDNYVLSDFELPWEECAPSARGAQRITARTDDNAIKDALSKGELTLNIEQDVCPRRFTRQPGYLLFNKPKTAKNGHDDKSSASLLLIYIVGETATAGIQKGALDSALNEIAVFCGWKQDDSNSFPKATWPSLGCRDNRQAAHEIRILAPTFTGSAPSIDLVLSRWIDSLPQPRPTLSINMVSGTATGIVPPLGNADQNSQVTISNKTTDDPCDLEEASGNFSPADTDFYATQLRLRDRFSFHSMENRDRITFPAFLEFLCQQHRPSHSPVKVAMLVEGGTSYGEAFSKIPTQTSPVQITNLVYPLHISQVRAEASKARQAAQQATQQTAAPSRQIGLEESLEEKSKLRDVETFSSATSVTSEEVVANILSAISREGDNYVGIVASDVRDVMFLAREVREHSPKVVLFTFTSDLLYLHPEINQSLRGMLVINSYPLNNSNQLWSLPSNTDVRLQFPDDASESTYNAMLALLHQDGRIADYSLPFLSTQTSTQSTDLHPAIWISAVGRDRLWPVLAEAPGDLHYTYQPNLSLKPDVPSWWLGVYPEGSIIFLFVTAVLTCTFCLLLVRRNWQSNPFDATWLGAGVAPPLSEKYRPQANLLLFTACASLLAFFTVTLTVLGIPAGRILWIGFPHLSWHPHGARFVAGLAVMVVCVVIMVLLPWATVTVFNSARRQFSWRWNSHHGNLSLASWLPIVVGSLLVFAFAVVFSEHWISKAVTADFRQALFTSIRYLDLTNGVSALVPLLLVSGAGFLWATSSFHRIRMLEGMCRGGTFLSFKASRFDCIRALERKLEHVLQRPSLHFRGSLVVLILAAASILYLFVMQLVPSFDSPLFYCMFTSAYLFVSLALWLGVLRFLSVWLNTHHMLQQLALTPMRHASTRFRQHFPAWPKIDLAMPAPSLSPLALSIDMLQTIVRFADRELDPGSRSTSQISREQTDALHLLTSVETRHHIEAARDSLVLAQIADANRPTNAGEWRWVLTHQCQAQSFLAEVTSTVSQALEKDWWHELHTSQDNSGPSSPIDQIFELCEEFLAARMSHFLAHVFPQMQNLIYTSVAGFLLMLFAISSYPFQPHNQLLFFNWVVVLTFVAIAVWVFIQMNRDPILSNLNGTMPGQITWDREFITRLLAYVVVPILALLSAQFPDTVGQIVAHISPSQAIHP